MPGDFSRTLFDHTKHYSGVLMQQGRVQLDADWNEQLALQQHRTHTETIDVVGACGAPKQGDSFLITQIPSGNDLLIGPGRFYADGLLCELDPTSVPITFPENMNNQATVPNLLLDGRVLDQGQWVEISAAQKSDTLLVQITSVDPNSVALTFDADVSAYQNAGAAYLRRAITYATQPDFPTPDFTSSSPLAGGPVALADGTYLVFLEAWQREVNALEDLRIRETALGGPDATERLQTVWQVKLLPVTPPGSPPSSPPNCSTDFPEWDQYIEPMTGMLNAQTVPPSDDQNPCVLPPSAGYQRLENQLYRIEIFQGAATRDQATFVWSRDNGTVESAITKVDDTHVYLHDLGRDDVLGFAKDQWVEIVVREDELQGAPRFLAQITEQPDPTDNKVTLSASAAAYTGRSGLRLRRWDMSGPSVTSNGIPITDGWIDIEAGIQVQFLEGSYAPRSYWQIPARTGTGEIEWPPYEVPNADPIPQLPLGVKHHYCQLALLEVIGGTWVLQDCRKKFPSLTTICADDVCYQSRCDMPGVATVQDALDQLCVARDLRFHNKHLHGWGIVCGLQVNCGPDDPYGPRQHVTVRSGYAIDCDGNDVILDQDQQIDVIDMLATSPPNYTVPDGDYCLILDPTVPGLFRFVPYDPSWSTMQSLLDDTLLMDFYNDCIKNLSDFFHSQFTPQPGEANQPVGPTQKRITALSNLFDQVVNPDTGSYVFLSGDHNNPNPQQEDSILRDFYQALRNELQSKTFCGMFDGARQFPDYPYSGTGIATIFGKGFKTRLRVDPTGSRAYTVGVDSKIHVYDLNAQQMALELDFPGGGIVQDVAFSADGTQLYAVSNLNNQDTIFAVADVAGLQHTWRTPTTVICNIILATLGTRASTANAVYALGVGQGLYTINPQNVSAAPTPTYPITNAFGHLVIDDTSGFAYATAAAAGPPGDHFDQVVAMNLVNTAQPLFTYSLANTDPTLQGKDGDDISVVPAGVMGAGGPGQLFVVAAGQANKQLLAYPTTETNPNPNVTATETDLGENTTVRLAYNPVASFLMLTFEDSNRIKLFNPNGLDPNRYPVQIQPLSIAFSGRAASTVYVLNYGSNTISAIPASLLQPSQKLDMNALLTYRSGAIDAFFDLLGGFLQYLKDCFCDHLLVQCPSCDEDDELFLGCVTIKGNEVYKVCNFSKRKYVKSFPTVGYWLSLVPIVPILHTIVQKICCAALPAIFGKYKAPQPSAAVAANPGRGAYTNRLSAKTVRSGVTFVQQTSFSGLAIASLGKLLDSTKFLGDYVATTARPPVPPPPTLHSSDVIGASVNEAKTKLAAANIAVDAVLPYDPTQVTANVTRYTAAPEHLRPGTVVTLVANRQNQVQYYMPSSPSVAQLKVQVDAAQKALADSLTKVATLQKQVADVQATNTRELSVRDQAIADLKLQVQKISASVKNAGPGGIISRFLRPRG